MGFLQNLAAVAIRTKVISTLRSNCPAALAEPLEKLLGDSSAVNAIQQLVSSCLRNPASFSAEAIRDLPLSSATTELLTNTPDLVNYLVRTARSAMPGS